MSRHVRARAIAWALSALAAAWLSGCSDSQGSLALQPVHTYGSQGQRFAMSFPAPPATTGPAVPSDPRTRYGVAVARDQSWCAHGVCVRVVSLEGRVPPGRVGPFLRSYLSFSTGGRLVTTRGLPAATGIFACSTPAGPCPGVAGDLDVLDGHTLYAVHTFAVSRATTEAVFASFRIAGRRAAAQPGSSP